MEQHTPSSLIVTFYGAFARDLGGWVAVADLIQLMGTVGVDPQSVRSAVSRLKRRGLLVPEKARGTAGYALSTDARELLADGDRRIYGPPVALADSGWVLAVFSVPESERHKRHLLRSRLARLGFGTAAPGVWIAPAHLYDEARRTLQRLGLSSYVDLFRGHHMGFRPTEETVRMWWDLQALSALHSAFLEVHEPVLRRWRDRETTPVREAFGDYLRTLDSWRQLPYRDPGLPAALLPSGWPGDRSTDVFGELHQRLRDTAAAFVAQTVLTVSER